MTKFFLFFLKVLEIFQLLAAANRAISCESHGKMVTKSLNTELLYSLCPSKNVRLTLKKIFQLKINFNFSRSLNLCERSELPMIRRI